MRVRFAGLRAWLGSTLRRRRLDEDLRAELDAHAELLAERYTRAGMSPAAARRAARDRLGNVTLVREDVYGMNGIRWVDELLQDLRHARRLFARQPAFSAVAIGTVALATGVTASLFSVIDAAILRPLPYPNPEQIVTAAVATRRQGMGDRVFHPSPSLVEMRRWQEAGVFSAIAGWDSVIPDRVIDGPTPERVTGREITSGYFAVFGVAPVIGRDFNEEDSAPGAPPAIILAHAYWRDRLGADPDVIGSTIRYDGEPAVVVGVVPAGFQPDVTVWRPMGAEARDPAERGEVGNVRGRLRDGIRIEEAERLLSAITPAGDARSPEGEVGTGRVALTSLLSRAAERSRATVALLAGAVGVLMLIGCVNVAGLLLARGTTRRAELAVRASMGAGRARLIRQLLIESTALSVSGCLVGVVVAWLSLDALVSMLPLSFQPGVPPVIDLRVLTACAVLAIATGIVCGLTPALALSRSGPGTVLRTVHGGRGHSLSPRGTQCLVAVEIALAVVLVVAGGLMIRSFDRLTSVDLGFDPEGVVAFTVVPVDAERAARASYYEDVLRAVRAIPGVESAGAVDAFALSQTRFSTAVWSEGVDTAAAVHHVLPGYFEAMGFRLRQGRFPTSAETGLAAVITASAARELFPAGGAIGHRITFHRAAFARTDRVPLSFDVVGVMADLHHGGPAGERRPSVFATLPADSGPSWLTATGMTVVVRPRQGQRVPEDLLLGATRGPGSRAIVGPVRTGPAWFGDLVATQRHRTVLIGTLAAFGLALVLVGIFSTTAYAVARRTREIGVRMALGAAPRSVVTMVIRDVAGPAAAGLIVGLGIAAYASRLVQDFLFEIGPRDPQAFAAGVVVIATTALAAAWVPARRAAQVDPVTTLRADG